MKATSAVSVALLVVTSSLAWGQQPDAHRPSSGGTPVAILQSPVPADEHFASPSLSLPQVTPELWIYSQEWRRHDDPAQAVRRKAEARTQQRMDRLAALKWYGFSNSRPQAAVTPFTSFYSPAWMGNGYDRYDWVGTTFPTTVVRVETFGVQR